MTDEALRPGDEAIRLGVRRSALLTANDVSTPARPLETVASLTRRPVYEVAKRALDLATATVSGFLVLPLMGVIAAAIRLESRGPALHRQHCAGLDGRPFVLLKFPLDADRRCSHLRPDRTQRDPRSHLQGAGRSAADARRAVPSASQPRRAPTTLERDPRRHVAGGPVPADRRGGRATAGVRARTFSGEPGLTGEWQVSGRSLIPFDEWMTLDLEYVQRPRCEAGPRDPRSHAGRW